LIEPFLPIGEYGPCPERLREQFEGVIWRFRTSSQWWEMPGEFGPWATVYGRSRVWRDAGVFTSLLEGVIAEAARQGQTDLSLVSVDSTTALRLKESLLGRSRGGLTRKVHLAADPQVPSVVVRPDRRTGRRQPAVRSRAAEGAGPSAGRPSTDPA
jgi:transposase